MANTKITIMTPQIKHYFFQRYYPLEDINQCFIWKGIFLTSGYGQLSIWKDNKLEHFLAHRISYMIHNNLSTLYEEEVLHKCPTGENKSCVNPFHLALGNQADNIKDLVKANRQLKGEDIGLSKLTEDDIIKIRLDYKSGNCTQRQLANKYCVSQHTIWSIVNRIGWKHI